MKKKKNHVIFEIFLNCALQILPHWKNLSVCLPFFKLCITNPFHTVKIQVFAWHFLNCALQILLTPENFKCVLDIQLLVLPRSYGTFRVLSLTNFMWKFLFLELPKRHYLPPGRSFRDASLFSPFKSNNPESSPFSIVHTSSSYVGTILKGKLILLNIFS